MFTCSERVGVGLPNAARYTRYKRLWKGISILALKITFVQDIELAKNISLFNVNFARGYRHKFFLTRYKKGRRI